MHRDHFGPRMLFDAAISQWECSFQDSQLDLRLQRWAIVTEAPHSSSRHSLRRSIEASWQSRGYWFRISSRCRWRPESKISGLHPKSVVCKFSLCIERIPTSESNEEKTFRFLNWFYLFSCWFRNPLGLCFRIHNIPSPLSGGPISFFLFGLVSHHWACIIACGLLHWILEDVFHFLFCIRISGRGQISQHKRLRRWCLWRNPSSRCSCSSIYPCWRRSGTGPSTGECCWGVNLPRWTDLDSWKASFSRTPKPPGNFGLVYSCRHLSSAALSSLAANKFCKSYI